MEEKEIPCEDCEREKEDVEEMGGTFVSCEPIPEKPGWCLFKWEI